MRAAFVGPGQQVVEVTRGQDVRDAVAEHEPDLVILDMQIGNMGGDRRARSTCGSRQSGGRLPTRPILLLLDREADRFLAKRADADAELVKPVDAGTLRRTVEGAARRRRSATRSRRAPMSRKAPRYTHPPLRDVAQFG